MKHKVQIGAMTLLILIILCGCRDYGSVDRKPDDDISRYIKERVGNSLYYQDRCDSENNEVCYSFEIMSMHADVISDFYDACQDVCSSDYKMMFMVFFHIPGGSATMFYLSNYNEEIVYDGLCNLHIIDQTHYDITACNPELYSEIEGIKELHVAEAIQEKADEMGIDWYEYWPDLETIVVEED